METTLLSSDGKKAVYCERIRIFVLKKKGGRGGYAHVLKALMKSILKH
jgi:hypothetical protein